MADPPVMDVCPVCLKEFGNLRIGKLPCSHIFCFPCIEEWSKNMNTCPVDRSKFNCIKVYLHVNGKCTGEVTVDDRKITELFIDDDNVTCELCHSEANENLLLLCDGCDRGFHTYCLTPPLADVPDGSWYCTRCLPIVTSVECLSDSDNSCNRGDSSDEDIVVSYNSVQRRSGRISSDSSSEDDGDSNFSVDNELVSSLPSSQICSSHDDTSSPITMTTDSDNSAESQQCSSNVVTDSNHDTDDTTPRIDTIASRIRIAYSNHQALHGDCLLADSNHDDYTNQLIPEQSSHGDNIKRRLRNYRSVKNGHRVCMRRNSTGSLARCILSVSDSEQSDVDYLPPRDSYPSSSSHSHTAIREVKFTKSRPQTCPSVTVSKSRGIKRRHRNKNKRGKKKRKKLQRSSLQHLKSTPTRAINRARTAATSPRVNTVSDTPQSAIRRLAKARFQAESLEEARKISRIQSSKLTQNDIIAHQVRQQGQQTSWWDHKAIDCHKSNTKVVCSPLKNAMKRHPKISPASLKYLNKSQKGKQTPQSVKSSDVIGNIFAGMDTLYNRDARVLRSGEIAAPPKH